MDESVDVIDLTRVFYLYFYPRCVRVAARCKEMNRQMKIIYKICLSWMSVDMDTLASTAIPVSRLIAGVFNL